MLLICNFAAWEARCTFVYTKQPKGSSVYHKVSLPLRGKITRNSLFMEKKNRRFQYLIRLSETERDLFSSKAAAFGSMASMVRTAVERLDLREIKSKYARLEEFTELFRSFDLQFRGVSANLNQAMHHANRLAIGDDLTKAYFAESIIPLSQSIHKDIMECKKYQKMIYAKLLMMD